MFGYRLLNVCGIHKLTSSQDGEGKSSERFFDRKGIHILNKQLNVDSLTPTCVQMSSDGTPNLSLARTQTNWSATLNDMQIRPRWLPLPTSLPSVFCWLVLLSLNALGVMWWLEQTTGWESCITSGQLVSKYVWKLSRACCWRSSSCWKRLWVSWRSNLLILFLLVLVATRCTYEYRRAVETGKVRTYVATLRHLLFATILSHLTYEVMECMLDALDHRSSARW